jgi:DNA-binding response OmpR family regulator
MKRVLIVDDEKSFLLSLRDGLSAHRRDFHVLTAENGREAVAVLRTVPIDLLVTDLKLPVMDGFELLAWVSRQQPQLPVIVMTAFGTAEIEARLSRMNALQYLEKPLDLDMLREGIYNGLKEGPKSYIRGITLATFLQLMSAEQKNCTLKVTVGERHGYLFIRRGELIDAEYNGFQGEDAAMQIVGWENAEIEMDGICRRQQQVISLSMEHILIEAFRRKDEQMQKAPEQTVPPAKIVVAEPEAGNEELFPGEVQTGVPVELPISAEELARKRLQQALKRLPTVQEFAIFDQKSFLEEKNPGKCSIAEFDPALFTHLVEQIDAQVSLGSFSSLSFRTASRYHYLLFKCQQHRVLTKLKPGSQPHEVMREIKTFVNR